MFININFNQSVYTAACVYAYRINGHRSSIYKTIVKKNIVT